MQDEGLSLCFLSGMHGFDLNPVTIISALKNTDETTFDLESCLDLFEQDLDQFMQKSVLYTFVED